MSDFDTRQLNKPQYLVNRKYFWPKMGNKNEGLIAKLHVMLHNLIIQKFKFSIGFVNVGQIGVKSPFVHYGCPLDCIFAVLTIKIQKFKGF